MPALPLNAIVGKYRVERLIGSGGMGEVYLARHVQTRAAVAVKVLSNADQGNAAARFRNEAVIQSSLRHPNVAALYEYFYHQQTPCIAMEFIEGRTLHDWIRETGGLEPAKALEIMADICDAVSYMHAKGAIHRDIKSENIRIDAYGKAKLLDFGIAVDKNTPAFTRVGCAIGTPEKMAPEQHQGLRGDARSDVWALGVLLYEMCTGTPPFANSSDLGLRQDILAGRYTPPQMRRTDLPKPIARIIANCLRVKIDERYASSGVLLREVQQVRRGLGDGPWGYMPEINPVYVVAAVLVLVLIIFIYALTSSPAGPGQEKTNNSIVDRVPSTTDTTSVLTSPPALKKPTFSAVLPRVSVPDPPSGSATKTLYPVEPAPDQRTVVLDFNDEGAAEVLDSRGRVIGRTPYELTGPIGSRHELTFRKSGFESRKLEIVIEPVMKPRMITLDRNPKY
jgi:serine/threonine-protein kinase